MPPPAQHYNQQDSTETGASPASPTHAPAYTCARSAQHPCSGRGTGRGATSGLFGSFQGSASRSAGAGAALGRPTAGRQAGTQPLLPIWVETPQLSAQTTGSCVQDWGLGLSLAKPGSAFCCVFSKQKMAPSRLAHPEPPTPDSLHPGTCFPPGPSLHNGAPGCNQSISAGHTQAGTAAVKAVGAACTENMLGLWLGVIHS